MKIGFKVSDGMGGFNEAYADQEGGVFTPKAITEIGDALVEVVLGSVGYRDDEDGGSGYFVPAPDPQPRIPSAGSPKNN